jgi:hypothetical protein
MTTQLPQQEYENGRYRIGEQRSAQRHLRKLAVRSPAPTSVLSQQEKENGYPRPVFLASRRHPLYFNHTQLFSEEA